MNEQKFLLLITDAFLPFLKQLGFSMDEPLISGKHYCVRFVGLSHIVIVSFEPSEDAMFIMVSDHKNGEPLDIDDRKKTPRLSDLNARYMPTVTNEERVENEKAFTYIVVDNENERLLLKAAKELRLVLPKHINS